MTWPTNTCKEGALAGLPADQGKEEDQSSWTVEGFNTIVRSELPKYPLKYLLTTLTNLGWQKAIPRNRKSNLIKPQYPAAQNTHLHRQNASKEVENKHNALLPYLIVRQKQQALQHPKPASTLLTACKRRQTSRSKSSSTLPNKRQTIFPSALDRIPTALKEQPKTASLIEQTSPTERIHRPERCPRNKASETNRGLQGREYLSLRRQTAIHNLARRRRVLPHRQSRQAGTQSGRRAANEEPSKKYSRSVAKMRPQESQPASLIGDADR